MMIKALIVEQVNLDGTLQSFKMSPRMNDDLIVAFAHEYEEPRFGPFHFLESSDESRFREGFANCKVRKLSERNFKKEGDTYEFTTNWQGIPTERSWLSYYALMLPEFAIPLAVKITDPHKSDRQNRKQVNRDDDKNRFIIFLKCSSSLGRFNFDLSCIFKIDKNNFSNYQYQDNKTENHGGTGDEWRNCVNEDQDKQIIQFFSGDIHMGDSYSNSGQVGAMGKNASASNNSFQQLANNQSLDIESLKKELEALRSYLKSEATIPEHDISVGEIAGAQAALENGNETKAIQHLKSAGKWSLDTATKIGTTVAAAAIKSSMGL